MRALVILLMITAAGFAPGGSSAPNCFGTQATVAGNDLVCERVSNTSCRVALVNETTGPVVDESPPCAPHSCPAVRAGRQAETTCEDREIANGHQRSTTIDVDAASGGDPLPGFHLRARFTRLDDANTGGSESNCRIQYERYSGPGPSSIEAGQPCAYPFLLP